MKNKQKKYDLTWIGLLEIKNRKILMTREKGKNLFQLPGGVQKEDEDYERTLEREIKEELGVEIRDIKIYDDFILPGRNEDALIRFLIYTAEIVGKIEAGDEIEEIRWVNSEYEKESIDIGNPTKLRLMPRLLREGVVD